MIFEIAFTKSCASLQLLHILEHDLHYTFSYSVPEILMINVPIFSHSGGYGNETFQAEKRIMEIFPTTEIDIANQNFTLTGIISHVNGTS